MNRICFVSKKEKAQHLGLNTGYVRENKEHPRKKSSSWNFAHFF